MKMAVAVQVMLQKLMILSDQPMHSYDLKVKQAHERMTNAFSS